MTLLLSVLTHDFVVQASDRRFTANNTTVIDDDANKSVLLENSLAFAFTGTAYSPVPYLVSPEESTNGKYEISSDWMARVLKKIIYEDGVVIPDDWTELVRIELSKSLTIAGRRYQRTVKVGFVGVGWGQARLNQPLLPLHIEMDLPMKCGREVRVIRPARTERVKDSRSLSAFEHGYKTFRYIQRGFDAANKSRMRISHRIVYASFRAGKGNQFVRNEIESIP